VQKEKDKREVEQLLKEEKEKWLRISFRKKSANKTFVWTR
jgi:hypothetical protein